MLRSSLRYYSERYGKSTTAPEGFVMDGATGATDILSIGWPIHDWLTDSGLAGPRNVGCRWDDGTTCSRWQSSTVLFDVLRAEGRWVRAPFWALATWLANPLGLSS